MGQYDKEAWYIVVVNIEVREGLRVVKSIVTRGTSAHDARDTVVSEVYSYKFFSVKVIDIFYCGQIEPIREHI